LAIEVGSQEDGIRLVVLALLLVHDTRTYTISKEEPMSLPRSRCTGGIRIISKDSAPRGQVCMKHEPADASAR
jgi:hypothetical protein